MFAKFCLGESSASYGRPISPVTVKHFLPEFGGLVKQFKSKKEIKKEKKKEEKKRHALYSG